MLVDDLLAGASPAMTRVERRVQRPLQVRAEAVLADAERLGDQRAAGSRLATSGQIAPAHARDAHGLATVSDEPRREARPRGRARPRSRPAGPAAASCASHGRSDCSSAVDTERARAHELDDLSAVGPDRFPRGDEGVALAYLRVSARRAAAERRAAAHVDGLRGDHEAEREQLLGHRDLLAQPARGQRGHRDAVLDALREHRRGGLGRDGMGERARLDHERLARPGQLRERAFAALGLGLLQAGAETGERRLQAA